VKDIIHDVRRKRLEEDWWISDDEKDS